MSESNETVTALDRIRGWREVPSWSIAVAA